MPTQARVLRDPVGPWTGPGLFSGVQCVMRVLPATAGAGIRIKGTSNSHIVDVPVHVSYVTTSLAWMALPPGVPEHIAQRVVRNTVITLGSRCAATVEHILSALVGVGISDATIELNAAEVPILEGSSKDFATALLLHSSPDSGLLHAMRGRAIRLTAPVSVRDDAGAAVTAFPLAEHEHPSAKYSLEYGAASPIPSQSAEWRGDPATYVEQIAPARTFSLEHEALAAQKMGFFKEFSTRELLVVNSSGAPIDNAWRFTDEPARHKLLDLIGDLALLGRPLLARVEASRSGHALTHQLCLAILAGQSST